MAPFAYRFGSREVAQSHIRNAVKDVVENCEGIGIPVLLEIRIRKLRPDDADDRSVDVVVDGTWE